jgi:hypothetical protein
MQGLKPLGPVPAGRRPVQRRTKDQIRAKRGVNPDDVVLTKRNVRLTTRQCLVDKTSSRHQILECLQQCINHSPIRWVHREASSGLADVHLERKFVSKALIKPFTMENPVIIANIEAGVIAAP